MEASGGICARAPERGAGGAPSATTVPIHTMAPPSCFLAAAGRATAAATIHRLPDPPSAFQLGLLRQPLRFYPFEFLAQRTLVFEQQLERRSILIDGRLAEARLDLRHAAVQAFHIVLESLYANL